MGHSGKPIEDILLQSYAPVSAPAAAAVGDATPAGDAAVGVPMETDPTTPTPTPPPASELPLRILENTLRWGNLCPTTPDSLPCYPCLDTDPFLLRDLREAPPQIVFAGNMQHYQTSKVQYTWGLKEPRSTRFICVPAFHTNR